MEKIAHSFSAGAGGGSSDSVPKSKPLQAKPAGASKHQNLVSKHVAATKQQSAMLYDVNDISTPANMTRYVKIYQLEHFKYHIL